MPNHDEEKKLTKKQPWHPAPYDEAVTGALKALHAGAANAGQQQRALNWIIEALCGTYDLSYRPGEDGERDSAFAEGKRFVGMQIVKQLKLTTEERRGG
jgi:hypothetical protein